MTGGARHPRLGCLDDLVFLVQSQYRAENARRNIIPVLGKHWYSSGEPRVTDSVPLLLGADTREGLRVPL